MFYHLVEFAHPRNVSISGATGHLLGVSRAVPQKSQSGVRAIPRRAPAGRERGARYILTTCTVTFSKSYLYDYLYYYFPYYFYYLYYYFY